MQVSLCDQRIKYYSRFHCFGVLGTECYSRKTKCHISRTATVKQNFTYMEEIIILIVCINKEKLMIKTDIYDTIAKVMKNKGYKFCMLVNKVVKLNSR